MRRFLSGLSSVLCVGSFSVAIGLIILFVQSKVRADPPFAECGTGCRCTNGPGKPCYYQDTYGWERCSWSLYYCGCVSPDPFDLCQMISGTFPEDP